MHVVLAFMAGESRGLFRDPATVRVFVSNGGWDMVVHLLLYPPPESVFYRETAVEYDGMNASLYDNDAILSVCLDFRV